MMPVNPQHEDDPLVNRCPHCRTPFSRGEIGPGTMLEIKCRRCKQVFLVGVPNAVKNVVSVEEPSELMGALQGANNRTKLERTVQDG
jgi:predicted Zn finger-like uncharacterized protein